ncbi:HAD-IC family P-type ATPase [Candidatus Microgenomates bacterium]|nr:HAD-IC family P-type ATPase [Candidatus Microgenomates bacterium]
MPTQLGLSSEVAAKKLGQFGPNVLPEKPPPNEFFILFSQFKSPLVYILFAAAFVTAVLGKIADTSIILVAVLINTVLGFWQERRANRALASLKQLVSPKAVVLRDGQQREILLSEVVAEDVMVLAPGRKVPADGEIIEATDMFVEEAILTGESMPVVKNKKDSVFMGTSVVSGHGFMLVKSTGAKTKMGNIAKTLSGSTQDTPLRRELRIFSKKLAGIVGVLVILVFLIGTARGEPIFEMFLTSVALSVSAIPEGLLVSTTAVLAIGMTRILKRKGLVRRLLAAETLGGVTVICADKTGTLTQGKLTVAQAVGDKQWLLKAAVLCNDLHDPFEIAILEWVPQKESSKLLQDYPRVSEIPFAEKFKYKATLHKEVVFVSGAPEILLGMSKSSREEIKNWKEKLEEFGIHGYRMVGFAKRDAYPGESKLSRGAIGELEFLGILLFEDPVRASVKEAFDQAKAAGIKIKIVTGDYPATAISVLAKLGQDVNRNNVLTGDELSQMHKDELFEKIPKTLLFARITPEQKLVIVEALKRHGEVVAMMGDGVNDAPALSRSDIGIVVGEASDVARESAELVLIDSNFKTIIAAVEEGRGIFDNLRKIVAYLLSDAFAEITVIVGAILLALPLPVTAAQILWINLVSDGFPNLALTVDPKRRNLMNEPPRKPREQLVTNKFAILVASVSIIAGVLALLVFTIFYFTTGDLVLSRSVAFLTLGVNSLVYVFSVRNLQDFIYKGGLFSNRWLILGVLAGFGLQALPFYVPFLRDFFDVVEVSLLHWGVAIGAGIIVVFSIEISKLLFLKR